MNIVARHSKETIQGDVNYFYDCVHDQQFFLYVSSLQDLLCNWKKRITNFNIKFNQLSHTFMY